jgi:hypothetical protein
MKRVCVISLVFSLCCAIAGADVVGYFKFDNIKGNSFSDDTGKGLIGTLGVPQGSGAPKVVTGPSGKSTDKAVEIPRGEGLIADDSTFFSLDIFAPRTIEMWVKAADFEMTESMVTLMSYGLDSGYRIILNSDKQIVYSLQGVQDFNTGVAFPFDSQWHHLAVVDDFDGNQIRVYLDGAEIFKTDTPADNNAADSNLLFIGRTGTTPNYIAFEGAIDRLRISNDSLTVDELDKDAANVNRLPIARWRFSTSMKAAFLTSARVRKRFWPLP